MGLSQPRNEAVGVSRPRFWIYLVLIYTLLLVWLADVVLIGSAHPLFLFFIVVPWLISFAVSKSTTVPVDPRQFHSSRRVHLSFEKYDHWAQHMVLVDKRFLDSPYIPWPFKMSLWLSVLGASMHVWAPAWGILLLVPQDLLLTLVAFSPGSEQFLSRIPPAQLIAFGLASAILLGQLGGFA